MDDEYAKQFKAMGVKIDQASIVSRDDSQIIELWPENWKTMLAFLSIETQWRYAGGGMGPLIFIGLDYAGAKAVLKGRSNSAWRRLIAQLQIMEKSALEVLNEKADD